MPDTVITEYRNNIEEKTGSVLPEGPYFSIPSLEPEAGLGSSLSNESVPSRNTRDFKRPSALSDAPKIKNADWLQYYPEELEIVIEWWKGKVLEVQKDYFSCELIDSKGQESTADIDLCNVNKGDIDNVKIGAEFTYVVSYQDKTTGRRTIDDLDFIPPSIWTKQKEEIYELTYKRLFPKDVTDF